MANLNRADRKYWWTQGYENWNNEQFKLRLRVTREIFGLILNTVSPYINKQPMNFVPNPIEEHRQKVLTLYRLAHSISFSTLSDLFGVSISLAERVFNVVIQEMVRPMYDTYVVLPESADA